MDVATWLTAWHGAVTVGITSYPALETRVIVEPPKLIPPLAVEVALIAPISRAEPIALRAGAHITLLRF